MIDFAVSNGRDGDYTGGSVLSGLMVVTGNHYSAVCLPGERGCFYMPWNVLPGITITVTLGLVILYHIDLNPLLSALQPVQYSLLVEAVFVPILTLFIRAWRWQYLLQPVKSVRTLQLCSATAIGFIANML